ncbi:leucine-rich_repeat domain-containing protein [Hexamita inflata]|uniref:Leucine-rich repeat domain-containing protein n=1 Tax=Hexamita inflata TaxID=28002 RepID=A0AA86NN27_9EUKA|nr:leucine-rich repeat domain-containing protein [Hexamita inflata]
MQTMLYYMESEYDQTMIKFQQQKIIDKSLRIGFNKHLESLNFVQQLEIQKLWIYNCENVIPKLNNNIIYELQINNCKLYNDDIENIQLENLKVLQLKKNRIRNIDSIIKFQHLTELDLEYNINININPIHKLKCLSSLNLSWCCLKNIENICKIISLKELKLIGNKEIIITPIQCLTGLTCLHLDGCNIDNVTALQPLVNLTQLYLYANRLVFIEPLKYLVNLESLNLRFNNIYSQNFKPIKNHVKYSQYDITNQYKPNPQQWKLANQMKLIDTPIHLLKSMKRAGFKMLLCLSKQQITQYLLKQLENHVQFTNQVVSLLNVMNSTLSDQ